MPEIPDLGPKQIDSMSSFRWLGILLLGAGVVACSEKQPLDMVQIPAGDFVMGTDEINSENLAKRFGIIKPWFTDTHPAHRIHLPDYYLDRYEVTRADYRELIQGTGRRPPPDWNGTEFPDGTAQFPVVMVSWHDARDYCLWHGKRLPTEAEWEKAARADLRNYPWGNDFDSSRANVGGHRGGLRPVGSYPEGQSVDGVFDLVGNAWEWISDWYQPYPGNPDNRQDYGKKFKVLRGNSWASVGHYPARIQNQIIAHNSLATFRLYANPNQLLNDIGFRCAKTK